MIIDFNLRPLEIAPLPAFAHSDPIERELWRVLGELARMPKRRDFLDWRRLGRRLVHGAIMRAAPNECGPSIDYQELAHIGHIPLVRKALLSGIRAGRGFLAGAGAAR